MTAGPAPATPEGFKLSQTAGARQILGATRNGLVGEAEKAAFEEEVDAAQNGVATTTWSPIDLRAVVNGADVPAPTLMSRTDDKKLLYPGRVHWFLGESEALKSMAAIKVAADVLTSGGTVLFIDFESEEQDVVARLLALGVPKETIVLALEYLRPDEPLADRYGNPTPAAAQLDELLTGGYELAVIDGVTEAMTVEDLKLTDNADVARWLRVLPKRIAATGPAVVAIDHVVKDREGQGQYAIGGQHKRAGVNGAAYRFTTVRPLSRATGDEPVEGLVAITVTKDRPGYVRAFAVEGKVGTLSVTAWPDGGLTVRILPPGEDLPDERLVRRILEHLDVYDGSSVRRPPSRVGR